MSPSPITIGVGNDARPRALLLTAAQGEPPPAQRQPPGPGQAEFVICDQTIESFAARLKQHPAIATLHDKRASHFLGAIHLAAAVVWLVRGHALAVLLRSPACCAGTVRRSRVAGVGVEDALELWASSLRDVKRRIAAAVHPGAGGGLGGAVPGRAARTGAAQDGLDAGGGGGRSRPLAPAGHAGPRPLGGRRAARRGARLCAGDAGRRGCGAGDRRDRLPQAGQGLLRRGAAVHRLGGQDHQLPDRRLRRLCVPARPRLHRPGALPAQGLDRRPGPPGGGARAARGRASPPSRGSRSR